MVQVCFQNDDGTPWVLGDGDDVYSRHVISGSKSNVPSDLDYVPCFLWD